MLGINGDEPQLTVFSYKGPYQVIFTKQPWQHIANILLQPAPAHVLIDKKIYNLYSDQLHFLENAVRILPIEATENNKSLQKLPSYLEHLISCDIKRNHILIAIGGGIIQEITCFIASVLLRGINWYLIPTTLLAQADACIGSKCSINFNGIKNVLGTFYPPVKILLSTMFLKTLTNSELCSGIGEMLKVHAIESQLAFETIASNYDLLLNDLNIMQHYIYKSLQIKKKIIELDEFDKDIRHILNYGHSFGHAIEAATDFGIPHGIAITIGMDLANYVSYRIGIGKDIYFYNRHDCLRKNYRNFINHKISLKKFFLALIKDKKNQDNRQANLMLLNQDARVQKYSVPISEKLKAIVSEYFKQYFVD